MRNTAYGLQFARSIFGLTITFRTVDGLDRACHGYSVRNMVHVFTIINCNEFFTSHPPAK